MSFSIYWYISPIEFTKADRAFTDSIIWQVAYELEVIRESTEANYVFGWVKPRGDLRYIEFLFNQLDFFSYSLVHISCDNCPSIPDYKEVIKLLEIYPILKSKFRFDI
jgi:hypothetical protein